MAVLIWRFPPVQAVTVGFARAGRNRGDAAGAGKLGVGGEPLSAGDLADELVSRQRPKTGLGEQLRSDPVDKLGDSCLERVDRRGQLAQVLELATSDPDPCGLLEASQARHDAPAPLLR